MPAPRRLISSGSPMEAALGYSRAVAQGPWCWVSGTTGYDYASMVMPESPERQTRNAVATIERALNEAGFALADIVRVRYYIAREDVHPAVAQTLGALFGEIRPAATMVVCPLIKDEMLIEIEADAYRPEA